MAASGATRVETFNWQCSSGGAGVQGNTSRGSCARVDGGGSGPTRARPHSRPQVVGAVAEPYIESRVERVIVNGLEEWVRAYGDGRAAGIAELCGCQPRD